MTALRKHDPHHYSHSPSLADDEADIEAVIHAIVDAVLSNDYDSQRERVESAVRTTLILANMSIGTDDFDDWLTT
jgi:hypothetical protein